MSGEEREYIKKIAKLRAILEKRIEKMETELDEMKTLLGLIDETLIKESFKSPQITHPIETLQKKEKPQTSKVKNQKRGIPLKTITGDILAKIHTEEDLTRIILAKDFEINTPPFTSFFVERVLAKMLEKDKENAREGKLDPDKTISFDIEQERNIIKEIKIKNLRPERIRELKSSIRWTLEKMYERMKQKN
jgi:hypothetical protein